MTAFDNNDDDSYGNDFAKRSMAHLSNAWRDACLQGLGFLAMDADGNISYLSLQDVIKATASMQKKQYQENN